MNLDKTMELSLKDVYQLLVAECRYGYRRNNHLMPGCAYDRVKALIPHMYNADQEYAIYTLKQICEECITDQIVYNFYDGYDDEHGNRLDAIRFVQWCMDWIHKHGAEGYRPYCWDSFEANLAKDGEKRYVVYEVLKTKNKCISDTMSLEEAKTFVFHQVAGTGQTVTYRNITIKEAGKHDSFKYEICLPVERTFIIKHI